MSDYSELASLADATHGPGSTMQMLARCRAFENACHPALIKELIADVDRLKAENESLRADAERYRHILANHSPHGYINVCMTESEIDAELGKGEQP